MDAIFDFSALVQTLSNSEFVLAQCVSHFQASTLRIPRKVESRAVAAQLAPILTAFTTLVAVDREGRRPSHLHFYPGLSELREIEQAVAFMAAGAAANRDQALINGYDVGALLFSVRDVLSVDLPDSAAKELQKYMEWLVVVAGDSLAYGREQAALERFSQELDEGTPILMITPDLPAAIFVCSPDSRVIAGVMGRLLFTIVRTGAKAVILDLRGVVPSSMPTILDGLQTFLANPRIGGKISIFIGGIQNEMLESWQELGKTTNTHFIFDNYFDSCVREALLLGSWRMISGTS